MYYFFPHKGGKNTMGNFKNLKSFQSFNNNLTHHLTRKLFIEMNYIIFAACYPLKNIKRCL